MSLLRRHLMMAAFFNQPIRFEDAEVERICVENWGKDGKITYSQILQVTNLGLKFNGNTTIRKFNELRMFKGLSTLNYGEFKGCTSLEEIDMSVCRNLPLAGKSWDNGIFQKCKSLRHVTGINQDCKLYDVPFCFEGCVLLTEEDLYLGRKSYAREALERTGIEIWNLPNVEILEASNFGETPKMRYLYLKSAREIGSYNFFYAKVMQGCFIGNHLEKLAYSWVFLNSSTKYIVVTSKVLSTVKGANVNIPVFVPDTVCDAYKAKFPTLKDVRKLSDFKKDFPNEPEIPWEYEL